MANIKAGDSIVHIVDDVLLPVAPLPTPAWLWMLTRQLQRADPSTKFPPFNAISAGGDAIAASMQRAAAAGGGSGAAAEEPASAAR